AGVDDAIAATPSARLRVAVDDHEQVVGYAITGRSGPRGYLQRLAVAPGQQGQGYGAALVLDGLRWLRRWGARDVLVNTQEENTAAVSLYQRLGFRLEADGLAVLHRRVGAG
ncbi:MAG TPA: GNAT family N-acetyltransferase, partial [Acidimicrobiales bacterium]